MTDALKEAYERYKLRRASKNEIVNVTIGYGYGINFVVPLLATKDASEETLKQKAIEHFIKYMPNQEQISSVNELLNGRKAFISIEREESQVMDNQKSSQIIADLFNAFILKDSGITHNNEINVLEEAMYFLQEHYINGEYNISSFEDYINCLYDEKSKK